MKYFDDQQQCGIDRRNLLKGLGSAAAAGASMSFDLRQSAIAQENPVDCSPIGVRGKTPKPFKTDSSLPVRIRKSAFDLSGQEIDRLKAAYAALRNLAQDKPNDPRGWLRQGHVHCWYCGGGDNGRAGEEIHGSWLFFPWHRAYLFFHERILCKLIRDDTFALPYWDWDSEGRQTFPSAYGDPSDRANPLFDMLRSARPGSGIPSAVISPRSLSLTMNAATANLFLGSQNNTMGAMERQPHGAVHIWTADTTMRSARNDMGILATASQDPVFFAHHGNIDRLWSVWLSLSPQHRNFVSPTWRTHAWQFYDENSVWTQIQISDVLDTQNSLRYDYQPPSKKPIWTFTPRREPSIATAEAPTAEPPLVVASAPQGIELGAAPVTQTVAIPKPLESKISALSADSAPEYVLHVEDIEVPGDRQAFFNVFLNLPGANASTSVEAANFVGTVTVLAKNKAQQEHQHNAFNAAFDITDALSEVAKGAAKLSVTLVPVAPSEAGAEAGRISFKRVYIDTL